MLLPHVGDLWHAFREYLDYVHACMHAGIANATTGGWGNLGGGFTQFFMPLVYRGMLSMHEPFIAWRYAMFVPGFMHILGGIMILFFSTDLPDGNYALLKKTGAMTKENPYSVMLNALANYRRGDLAMHARINFCDKDKQW